MARISIHDLKQVHGVSQADINLTRETQEAQRKAGAPVLPIAVLVGAHERRPKAANNIIDRDNVLNRQRRNRGEYDQAAVMLDRQAVAEKNPERAMKAPELAHGARNLAVPCNFNLTFLEGAT